MKKKLINKKVLLLVPYFFGYEVKIKEKLNEMGAEVTMCDDDPDSILSTAIETCWHYKKKGTYLIKKFENSIYEKVSKNKYDIVLVINGWAVTSRLVKMIKNNLINKDGKMYLYYWDSIIVLRDDANRRKYFDKIYTFDNVDYEANKDIMEFLPLFYCDEYYVENEYSQSEVDLRTIGSYKYNRYFEIKELIKSNPKVKIDYILYAKYIVFLHKLLRKKYKDVDVKSFVYKPLSRKKIMELYSKSNAVLDIPFKGQNGLTMRTFECLAMKKKIITSNKNIAKYDFYNPEFIYILDTESYRLPNKGWFEKKIEWPENIIKQYSIGKWIEQILEIDD